MFTEITRSFHVSVLDSLEYSQRALTIERKTIYLIKNCILPAQKAEKIR